MMKLKRQIIIDDMDSLQATHTSYTYIYQPIEQLFTPFLTL